MVERISEITLAIKTGSKQLGNRYSVPLTVEDLKKNFSADQLAAIAKALEVEVAPKKIDKTITDHDVTATINAWCCVMHGEHMDRGAPEGTEKPGVKPKFDLDGNELYDDGRSKSDKQNEIAFSIVKAAIAKVSQRPSKIEGLLMHKYWLCKHPASYPVFPEFSESGESCEMPRVIAESWGIDEAYVKKVTLLRVRALVRKALEKK